MAVADALTVLAVEDNPIVRADLRLVLEDAGFTVCADARDGEEAIALAAEHEPDVIVMDLGLPGVSGIEATRRILSARQVPIVAITGREEQLGAEALDAGVVSVVRKPFLVPAMVDSIREAVAAPRLELARSQSRATLRLLAELVGHPGEWGDELEEIAFARGFTWRLSDPGTQE